MTLTGDVDLLMQMLGERLHIMYAENIQPYETETVDLSTGHITMLIKALGLLKAVRIATS